jgi:hypothetical protein
MPLKIRLCFLRVPLKLAHVWMCGSKVPGFNDHFRKPAKAELYLALPPIRVLESRRR